MGNSQGSRLVSVSLMDDAVWEATEDMPPTSATKYGTKQRIG